MTRFNRSQSSARANHGMSLVEVLVALVVISTGLLGVAGLQVLTLQNNHNSLLRTQASALADDILERMRANRDPSNAAASLASYVHNFGAPTGSGTRAKDDIAGWITLVRATMPTAPDGSVSDGSVAVNGNLVTVTIRWGELTTKKQASSAELNNAALTFQTVSEI
jgi:type IV pilus assembly protein PilV